MPGHAILSHGLNSSPRAAKVSAMAEIAESMGWTTERPDYQDLDATQDLRRIDDRIERLLAHARTCWQRNWSWQSSWAVQRVDTLLRSIADNPTSGVRLEGRLAGWLVRHGGTGHRLTIVFRPDVEADIIYLALVAFGGRDWMRLASTRHMFPDF